MNNLYQMNTSQAYQTLNVNSDAPFQDVKIAYRRLALELHPDKNNGEAEGKKFKQVTEAYHYLKNEQKKRNSSATKKTDWKYTDVKTKKSRDFTKKKTGWGVPPGEKIPEQDWGKFTKEFEEENPSFWKAYEKKFWEEYNEQIKPGKNSKEFEKTKESKEQPNLFVDVDPTLCIGCCSCETIAPEVFLVEKSSRMNPKSHVINRRGAGLNKIMNAAQTCPTKAIIVEDQDKKERLYPY